MARDCRNSPLLGQQQRNPCVRIGIVGAQAAHHRARLKDPGPGIANRHPPAQPTPPLFQDLEMNRQPECRMFLQRLAPVASSRLQVSAVHPGRTSWLRNPPDAPSRTFAGTGETAAGLAGENQEEFLLGQNSGVAECGFRDIRIGRRKQHQRLRFPISSTTASPGASSPSPAVVRIVLVIHHLPQLLKAQVRRGAAATQNAAHQTLVQSRVEHLQRYSQLESQSFCHHRRPAHRQRATSAEFLGQSKREPHVLQFRLQRLTDHVPPVDAKAIHNASHAGFKQVTPNLQVLNFDGEVENAEDRTAQRGTPFVIKGLWGASQVDHRIPMLTCPRTVEVIVGM